MRELLTVLMEVISVTPAIAPSRRSSGVVTLVDTVSGEAPGKLAWTWMVGNSTLGSGDTGSFRKPSSPASRMPAVSSVVATGRAMKGADRFIMAAGSRAHPAAAKDAGACQAGCRGCAGQCGRRQDISPAW